MPQNQIRINELQMHEDRETRRGRTLNFVAYSYNHIRNLSPIVASNSYPEAPSALKLNADSINYLVDVDNAVQKKIGNDSFLYAEWKKLVNGEEVGSAVIARLARKLGRTFESRQLHPFKYFVTVKKNTPGMRRVPLRVAA